jgi:16S rRNA (uracil1498-N3)-methyltransferase
VERVDQATVSSFHAPVPLEPGGTVTLGEDTAHHMRVARLAVGAPVALVDGAGTRARGRLVRLTKAQALIEVDTAAFVEPPPPVHLLVPIADRERMLWLAEKCAELALTSWRPVLWRRSRSVSPRGEGSTFHAKVRARMAAALAQSEGPYLPATFPDATVERAIAAAPPGARWVLAPDGAPAAAERVRGPVTVALGPEGGLERAELAQLVAAGFRPVSLGGNVMRFETAGVAALAVARALLAAHAPPAPEPADV